MISYVTGDLFDSPAQTIVNTVNTVGVMGKGIALTFKKLFPEMFAEYQSLCERRQLSIGSLHVFQAPTKLIINFPTKTTWKLPSRPEYIEAGLATFAARYREIGVHSIAFPPLGCGNGELDFASQVRPLMEKYLDPLPIRVFLYPPRPTTGKLEHQDLARMRKWLQSEPRALPFEEVWAELKELLGAQRSFETIARGSEFEAVLVSTPERIRVRSAGKTTSFLEEEARDVWRELRHHMVVTPKSLPHRERDLSYLLAVFARLPYVDTIEMADNLEDLTFTPTHGIRLAPVAESNSQPELALTS